MDSDFENWQAARDRRIFRCWFHFNITNELAIPEQTTTGKGIPNPLMAGSLPKTIKPTELDVAVLLKRQVADEDG
ncbi:hypothetical protein Tco_0448321 [Tanacetum coccineum]